MIERGSGRTSGLTDWRLMDVLSIWACVQDQDTAGQWKQVAGWRKVCDLALAHLSRLREYRRGLADAWPPETNAAARAYIAELDQLIERVQRTHDAAAANYDALAAAARAIGSARAELQPLHEEYEKKLRQKQAYEATIADPKAVAGSRLPERPPVTDDDLEQLNVRARGLMTGLSGELQHAQVMLQRPPAPARPGPRADPHSSDPYLGSDPAPIIPPIVAVPIAPSAPMTGRRPNVAANPPTQAGMPHTSGVIGGGPILGNAGSGAPTQAVPPGVVSSATPGTPSGTPGIPLPSAPNRGASVSPLGNDPVAGKGTNRPLPPRATATNGLIPGVPLGQPPTGGPYRRVNPPGGVIGGGAAGTAPTGAAGSRPSAGRGPNLGAHGLTPLGGAPGLPPTHGRQNSKDAGRDSELRWDPDNPWEVERGVDPVLEPPDEGPIDPGPAIGFNR
ncbi:hypothetical protein O7604_05310 [Micromonospora sp. WMMA1947]|nr:hypothetical protein [Micromonospora sp. WMMA1947]WBC10301.1 hypothetical protein O7604_05310 [Micromonospora sp. WMMA1947]